MIYHFPKMTVENEFVDLAFVAGFSDRMIAETGDQDWGVVYEFFDDDPTDDLHGDTDEHFDDAVSDPPRPRAVLLRANGQWFRLPVRTANFVNGKWDIDGMTVSKLNFRSYEIKKTAVGWKLTMYEDGQEVGGGVGGPEDCDFLVEQAAEFCGK